MPKTFKEFLKGEIIILVVTAFLCLLVFLMFYYEANKNELTQLENARRKLFLLDKNDRLRQELPGIEQSNLVLSNDKEILELETENLTLAQTDVNYHSRKKVLRSL